MTEFKRTKPVLYAREGGVLSLSGSGLRDLLLAVLERDMSFRFTAKGLSMSPFIRDGDVITVSPFSDRKPGLGDVMAVIHPGTNRLVVHRGLRQKGDVWQLCGDNVLTSDGWVPPDNIIGRVNRIERNGRQLRLGMGPERVLIAFLKRKSQSVPGAANILRPLRPLMTTLSRTIMKVF